MISARPQSGFSLVELSIVLVILGLLTGGILAGQSLIRAAELRAVSTEYSRYTTAVQTFRDKYFMLPGDMTNATDFWGVAGGDGSVGHNACRTAVVIEGHTGTCRGDGTSILEHNGAGDARLFWEHLRLSGLVEGAFYPWSFSNNNAVTGVHVPSSKIGNQAGWFACHTTRGSFGRPARNMFILTSAPWTTAACSGGLTAGISAPEAWGIDTKMDDGLATTGIMTAMNSFNAQTDCLTDNFSLETISSQYELNRDISSCHLYFVLN
ncbi:type II secretion system protein [Blastomonas sp. CACIA14H2]|uniref:type II secretion system protein n=1 Tax=Blastomonas sp. CACIA14H2 TaxID=1419876 RepID=UPI0026DA1C50